jgi:hypothetical protein
MNFLSNKRNCSFKRERVTTNSRSSLHLKRERDNLDQELALSKETTSGLKSSIVALQGQHYVLQKTH